MYRDTLKVGLICAFCGRHSKVERVIRCFLNQTHDGTLLLYNNSASIQELGDFDIPEGKTIILVNNHLDRETKEEYTNTGAIFRDALTFLPEDIDICNHSDSDDLFLSTHIKNGVEGMKKAYLNKQLAFKPYNSWYLDINGMQLVHNTLEPSIFVDFKYIKKAGFNNVGVQYHQKWLDPLINNNQILIDSEAKPTLIYNWEQNHGVHKISGADDTPVNFQNHRKWSIDEGDFLLNPCSKDEINKYYSLTLV